MRHKLIAVSTLALMAAPATTFAADQDFTLKNKTGYQIDDVYISRHSESAWGSDVMGRGNVLVDGDCTEISFHDRARGCHWDMKVKYNDETTAEWSDLNLCEISTVTLHYDRKNDVTRASVE